MIEFYNQFIIPSSPLRSKLAIHLIAQGTSLPEEKPEAQAALAVNKDRKDAEDGEAISVKAEGNGTKPFVITDVRQYKSMLQVSAGPQPVKHISEFEELDAKL
jgi:insulysin